MNDEYKDLSVGDFEPQTAREALLEIRRELASACNEHKGITHVQVGYIDQLVMEVFGRSNPADFELTDLLADRLAEAHKVLREVDDMGEIDFGRGLATDAISKALALPPDLEAMVERRIG